MNILNKIGLLAILALFMVGCIDKTPDYGNFPGRDVDFTYSVDGEMYPLDFYVVSTIQFNNTSAKTGALLWDFGDGTTSTEAQPKHKYAEAGLYKVSLTVEGVGTKTYPLMINDIVPMLSIVNQSADILVINDVTIELSLFLPNPENLVTRFEWSFPEGTTREDGSEITSFTGYSHEDGSIDYPGALRFKNIGSQKIEVKTTFDINGENRTLDDSYANVQVGCSYPCKTIYYAVLDGNIKAYKLADLSKLPQGTKILPFDMGVKSGSMPQQMVLTNASSVGEGGATIVEDNIYILDAGKQYTYIDDADGINGDGKISVMSADGSSVNTMVSNVGQAAFDDPFQGCADNLYLYYTDRNLGVRKRPLSDRGAKETKDEGSYLVQNGWLLAYYGKGISYGAIHTGIYLDSKGIFWWPKSYSGNGIYRFRTSDINKPTIEFPIVLPGSNPKAFTIDETRNMMYAWMFKGTPGAGFVAYDLPADNAGGDAAKYVKFIPMDADPINATADEGVYVSQFALDKSNGNVYFGFRKISTDTQGKYATGLYYYAPGASDVKRIDNVNDKILGIVINERETKLF